MAPESSSSSSSAETSAAVTSGDGSATTAAAAAADPSVALSECLFSQYAFTVSGVATGTGYALVRKPRNGIGLMLVAGAGGTLADLMYGWVRACQPQVEAWRRAPPTPPRPSSKSSGQQQ